MSGWGFTSRPAITVGNAIFRGMVGGSGAKQAIVEAIERGEFIVSPHGNGERDHTNATRITTQEAAALQTYPRDFEFAGNKGKVGLQIGNAVPPLLARRVLEAVWT